MGTLVKFHGADTTKAPISMKPDYPEDCPYHVSVSPLAPDHAFAGGLKPHWMRL